MSNIFFSDYAIRLTSILEDSDWSKVSSLANDFIYDVTKSNVSIFIN